jgi:glycosyltransferase involved in cell wall biosynthesis
MTQPLVSVLLPVRNAAATLGECLVSLGAQTLQGAQIVAVDHGSTDGSVEILKGFPGLTLVSYPGGSLLDALNAGLAACQGRYIARMDADDRCLAGRLQAQAAYLGAHPETALCGTQVRLFAEGGVSEGYRAYEQWVNAVLTPADIQRELLVECPLPHPTWMGRREAFEQLGGYADDSLPEDYHFILRCAQAGLGLAKLPEVLLEWREHPQRHSRTHDRYGRHAFFRLKARYMAALVLKGRPACVWGAGERARLLIRYLQAEGVKVEFAVGFPARTEGGPTEAHGVPVIPPEAVPMDLPGPLLVCVGSPGVKPEIKAWMAQRGWNEGEQWRFVS